MKKLLLTISLVTAFSGTVLADIPYTLLAKIEEQKHFDLAPNQNSGICPETLVTKHRRARNDVTGYDDDITYLNWPDVKLTIDNMSSSESHTIYVSDKCRIISLSTDEVDSASSIREVQCKKGIFSKFETVRKTTLELRLMKKGFELKEKTESPDRAPEIAKCEYVTSKEINRRQDIEDGTANF